MALALLAGVPPKLVRQVKAAAAALPSNIRLAWEVKTFPADGTDVQIDKRKIPLLLERASQSTGTHIIGFHQTDGRSEIANAVRRHFRFRWGEAPKLWIVAQNIASFRDYLLEILSEEDKWRDFVMPLGRDSPLILPSGVFEPKHRHADIWGECEMFNREDNHFPQLGRKIKHFSKEHLKQKEGNPSYFVDASSLVWKDSGPFHGITPLFRDWKYSHKLVPGFHFDVEHEGEAGFLLTDALAGKHTIKPKKHINIDSHGFNSH